MSNADIIARLEAATGRDQELDGVIFFQVERHRAEIAYWNATVGMPKPLEVMPVSGLGKRAIEVSAPRYTDSIDAALTLVPTGMWWWIIGYGRVRSDEPLCGVQIRNPDGSYQLLSEAEHDCMAIALCIAALKARA